MQEEHYMDFRPRLDSDAATIDSGYLIPLASPPNHIEDFGQSPLPDRRQNDILPAVSCPLLVAMDMNTLTTHHRDPMLTLDRRTMPASHPRYDKPLTIETLDRGTSTRHHRSIPPSRASTRRSKPPSHKASSMVAQTVAQTKKKCGCCVVLLSLALICLVIGLSVILGIFLTNKKQEDQTVFQVGRLEAKEEKVYRFEYSKKSGGTDQVVINKKRNYTEMWADGITVYNYFDKKVSLHKLDIISGVPACLVKPIQNEVHPEELEVALEHSSQIEVNASVLFLMDKPYSLSEDMTINQFCGNAPLYTLTKASDDPAENNPLTVEAFLNENDNGEPIYRYERAAASDTHHGPYHCGGPKGSDNVAQPYQCARSRTVCYTRLVNEKCDECYHGHSWRTRGCWCPISAIQTCIRISWKPVQRRCCSVDRSPCTAEECESGRPFIPIPEITFKIIETSSPELQTDIHVLTKPPQQ